MKDLEALADWKERLQCKIERGYWCLNLLLLDGIDRQELDALKAEVARFTEACHAFNRRAAA
jgi:hypothetical protein